MGATRQRKMPTMILSIAVLSVCVPLLAQDSARCPTSQSVQLAASQLNATPPFQRVGAALGSGLKLLDKQINVPISLSRGISSVQVVQSHVLNSQEMNALKSQLGKNLVPTSNQQTSLLLNVYSQTWWYLNQQIHGINPNTPEVIANAWLSDRELLLTDLKSHGFADFESARKAAVSNTDMFSEAGIEVAAIAKDCSTGQIREMSSDYSKLSSLNSVPEVSKFLSDNTASWVWLKDTVAKLDHEEETNRVAALAEAVKEQADRQHQQATAFAEKQAQENSTEAASIHNDLIAAEVCPSGNIVMQPPLNVSFGQLKKMSTQIDTALSRLKDCVDRIDSSLAAKVADNDPSITLLGSTDQDKLRKLKEEIQTAQDGVQHLHNLSVAIASNLQLMIDLQKEIVLNSIAISDDYTRYFDTTIPIYMKQANAMENATKAKVRSLRPRLDKEFWDSAETMLQAWTDRMPAMQGIKCQGVLNDFRLQ